MLPKKVRTLLATLGRSQSGEMSMRQPPQRNITVIFLVAIAVRKFQKFESNKYKKSLIFHFDKQDALDELRSLFAADKAFFVKEFVKLAYFARKFNLTFQDLDSLDENIHMSDSIFKCLENALGSKLAAADERMLLFLCFTLKYLIQNSEINIAEVCTISHLIRICKSPHIKNELVSMLMSSFEKISNSSQNEELEKLVSDLPEIDEDAKAYLLTKLEINKAAEKREKNDHSRPTMEIKKVKKNQQVVSKTIQTVKSKQESKKSEEADFTFLKLSACMKNRNKSRNVVLEPLDQIENKSGSDRAFYRNTWAEAITLFELASQGQVLKDDDKDNYLPKKLFGSHYFAGAAAPTGKMYSFFINRMLISIFCKISRKQKLNDKAIDKLLKCITGFENLLSVLGIEEDFVNFFVRLIFSGYWDLKKITSPDIVAKFAQKIMKETTEEYPVRGWFYFNSSTAVKETSYERAEVEKIIAAEINNVRVDAITAFYRSAIRNKETVLTKERLEAISNYAKNQSEDCSHPNREFTERIFKLMELAETLNDFDYAECFQIYLDLLNPDSTQNADVMLRFMLNQARDEKRSEKLFNGYVMETLIQLIEPKSCYSKEQKLKVMEIINTFLEHENSESLSEENLKKLTNYSFKSDDKTLIKSGLTSLLYSTNKAQSLPEDVLKNLIRLFDLQSRDEECTSYIVFILSRVFCADDATQKHHFLGDPFFLELISNKISTDHDHIVKLDDEDGEGVKILNSESEQSSYNFSNRVSFLSAKIISRSVENKVVLSSVTIDNLLLVLQSNNEDDKQTKIVVSRCLYALTKYMSFKGDVLSQLLNLINDPIYDVSVYLQTAYLRECVKVAQTSNSRLDSIHLENISALFVPDSLMLGEHDFEEEINKDLFKTLLYESRKQEFSDKNIFFLFDNILSMNGKYASQVLGILVPYSYNYVVPESTVRTLENLLNISSYFEKSLEVLQNVIFFGQVSVTHKTLTVFIDYLCSSVNSRLRFYSFKLLQQASQNQELPQDIFFKFELVRAGYALQCQPKDKEMILKFIEVLTDKGMQLPVDTKLVLEKEIRNSDVLKIFANVSRNKQIIEQNFLHDLINLFDPTVATNKEKYLIKIFENAAKNNQTLPPHLLKKLEVALSKSNLEKIVLPVFIYLAQKGESLSQQINGKLLDWLSSEQDLVLKQELLSSLRSLINTNKRSIHLYLSKLNQILAKEIISDNFNVQKLCMTAIWKLTDVSKQIDNDLLEKLIQIGTDFSCNEFIKEEIKNFFESVNDTYNPLISQKRCREQMKLASLHSLPPKDLLDQLNGYANLMEHGFLPQNYKQLKDLIDDGSKGLQKEALSLLCNYRYKKKITDELLESVALLYKSTTAENVKNLCLKLFDDTVKDGKALTGTANEIWEIELNQGENVKTFLRSQLISEIKEEFQLNDQIISDLLQNTKKLSGVKTLADIVELITKDEANYFECESFVQLVEQCLKKNRILEIALPCYCRIIKERKARNAEECLLALVSHFCENESNMVNLQQPLLFECMHYANKLPKCKLPDVCMQLAVNNLDNSNEIIRKYSFAILRTSYEKHRNYAEILNYWSDIILKDISDKANVEIKKSNDYLDVLEIIVSLKFFDVTILKTKERDKWKRELLTSSIFENFKVLQVDQLHFYANWLVVEEKFEYDKSCKILSLIQNSKFDSFSEVIKLTSMICDFTFDDAFRMIAIYGPEPYEAFKQDWCMRKIQTCLSSSISKNYCSKLAEKLCSNCDINFIDKLFGCLKRIDNLSMFEDLMEFCSREKIDLEDMMDLENFQLSDLKLLIEAKHLCKKCKNGPESEVEEKSFLQIYVNLSRVGWNFSQLYELVTAFNSKSSFQNLLYILNTIHVYYLSPSSNFGKCKQILTESNSFKETIRKLNKVAIENHFQLRGKEEDLSGLLEKLKESNESNPALIDFIDKGRLNVKQLIFEKESAKLSWNEKQIYLWARDIKFNKTEFSEYEAIAVILRANFLVTGHTLTDIQILCSLVALRSGTEKLNGKLLQVATGEGKSTIICILAIINALRGKQVDVITSSPVLAERDAKQKAKLYRLFGLTCSDNNDKIVYLKGKKDCYSSDIVYGEMSQFQFDLLRSNYSKLGTMGNREFTVAIVDEVDSMLIDDSSKIARLSATVPGMDHFQGIYVFIWQALLSIKKRFIMFQNKMYCVNGKIGFEKGRITLEIVDENNDIVKIPDLEIYLLSEKDISSVGEVVDDIDNYIRKSLKEYLDFQIRHNKIYIPSNFTEFLNKQMSKWIANAVEALNYQENVHYVVQNGEIKPVDYYSTGIVQSSTNWSDGLHQFLQLKHNLKMTSETLTTNFLSNIGFMKKYKQVYGLTGTLGSKTARSVLQDVYNFELINIPQSRQKQFLELEAIVAQGEASWLKEISANIMLEIQKERSILVICETIECANRISGILKNKLRSSAVKLYTMNDMNQEKNVEKIMPGEVIIATNLAGRGTDINTDEIEETGGLHVIVTFMPSNQRVEDQAFGRTARQGKRGTGLMILNAHTLVVGNATVTKDMKIERDKLESIQLKEFRDKELKLIQVKDSLFNRFCLFLNNKLRVQIRKEHNSYAKKIVNWFTEVLPTTYESCVLAAVEEQWAGFLSKLDEGIIKCEDAESKCEELISRLQNEFDSKTLIKNPYYNIIIGNDILVNDWFTTKKRVNEALDYFKKAIESEEKHRQSKKEEMKSKLKNLFKRNKESGSESNEEEQFGKIESVEVMEVASGAAHLGVAWCFLILKENGYKDEALSSFKSALKCLSNEMSLLNATQILLEQKHPGFVNSDLYKQLNVKASILGSYLSGISGCIDAINRSKRLIDITSTEKVHNKKGILEKIKYFSGLERNEEQKSEFKSKDFELKNDKCYSMIFNHLTRREDSGVIDQALITLQKSLGEELPTTYSDVRINLKQVELARIYNSLFNCDKEFKDLTRESAIAKLKEERSYRHKFGLTTSLKTNLIISSNENSNLNTIHEDQQINELIEIVEKQKISDNDLRFDIVIKQGNENEINTFFLSSENGEKSIKLNVHFDNLSQEAAVEKLSSVKAKLFDVEFVLDKSNLLKLIKSNPTLKSGKLYDGENQLFEKVDLNELENRVRKLKTDETPCFLRLDQLTLDDAKNIVNNCPKNVVFGISFIDVGDWSKFLDCGQANFSFDKLNRGTAEMVINVLRNQNFEFSLEFQNLTDKQVKLVLKNANLEQENIEIRKVKSIFDLFMKGSSFPTHELSEFSLKGIEHIIEINEKLFVPWRSVAVVASLGIGQTILGGVLIATGFGSSIGMSIVSEGLSDVFTAYRAYSSRQFHWSNYCKQKAISMSLSLGTMGLSKLKNAGKGIQTLTAEAGREALEQAGTQLISNQQVVGRTLVKTGANLKSLACKFISVKAAEAVGRECLNTGIKYLSDVSFDLLKPKISESVQSRVRLSFCNTELIGLLRKMYAIDLVSKFYGLKSDQLQSRIDSIVSETVNPQNDFMRRQWESVGLPLLKGILSDSSMYGNIASMTFRIMGTLNGLYQVQTLTDNVVSALVSKLKLVDRNSMTITLVLHKNLKIKKDNAKAIANKFKKLDIFDEFDNFQICQSDAKSECQKLKVKINKFCNEWNEDCSTVLKDLKAVDVENVEEKTLQNDVGKCIDFVNHFYEEFVNIVESDLDSFSTIMKSVSDQIAIQLIRIMDSQLLQPWSTLVVSSVTASISERIQHFYLVNKDQNSDSQNEDQEKYEKLKQKKIEDLTQQEKTFMANYGKYRVFSQQINYNSSDYCLAYSQCEMAYFSVKDESAVDNNSHSKILKEAADDIRNGGPANLAVMMLSSKMNGVNLKIVDDINYKKTQEDYDNGVEVIYFQRDSDNEIGHAYYMDGNGQFVEGKNSLGNDCFFAALSSILEYKAAQNPGVQTKSVDELRKEAAKQIELKPKNFTKVLAAGERIKDLHPGCYNNFLFNSGLRYKKKDPNNPNSELILEVEEDDLEKLEKSCRRGKDDKFEGPIKRAIPKISTVDGKEDSEVKESLHHIVSQPQIRAMVLEHIEDPEFRSQLEEMINLPEIRAVIDNCYFIEQTDMEDPLNIPDQENNPMVVTPENRGRFLQALIVWHKNNLVNGPIRRERARDPGYETDKELLEQQTESFRKYFKNRDLIFKDKSPLTFDEFRNLPGVTHGDWEKNKKGEYVFKSFNSANGQGGGSSN